MSGRGWRAVVVLVPLALLVACSEGSGTQEASTSSRRGRPAAGEVTGGITVSAAASLTEAFDAIGKQFEHQHRGTDVAFSFGASSTLATQVEQGAPVDVFASADEADVQRIVSAGKVDGAPIVFARNDLVIVTKRGNPHHVRRLADLPALGVVALCGAEVPCGRYAAQALRKAAVTLPAGRITRGEDVTATLGAVTQGDADAAIVYATDAASAGRAVTVVPIPPADNVIATYPIAVVKRTTDAATARAFVRFVTSRRGEAVLASFGFLPPG